MVTNLLKMTALLLITAAVFYISSCKKESNQVTAPADQGETFVIGGLLSLSGGNWNTLGVASKAAMEIARDEVNDYFTSLKSGISVTLALVDTRLDTASAVRGARDLIGSGVQAIVGPQSSAEVRAVLNAVPLDNVLLVSQGSTASSLSLTGDNIFRFCPDDRLEGAATAALVIADSLKALVPLCRADAGNIGLFQSTIAALRAQRIHLTDGMKYGQGMADYSAVIRTARDQVTPFVRSYGTSRTGIYLAGFDEAATILQLAANDSVLARLPWYGGDGTALSQTILQDPGAAAFAAKVRFICPSYGLEEAAKNRWQPLVEKIISRTGVTPDAFALAAYDAVWVLALAFEKTRGLHDIALLRSAFLLTAGQYYGATGWTVLNDAGDRKNGDFDFWLVQDSSGQYMWKNAASFNSLLGTITRH